MKKFFSLFLSVIITASMLTANGISVYSYADETIGSSEESTGFSAADSDEDSDLDSDLDFDSDFEYSISDGSVIITKYIGSDTDVSVPSEIDGMPVTEIGENAFSSCENLQAVQFKAPIEEIAPHAFCNCKNLTTINIPEGVKKICSGAFSWCTKLKNIHLPSTLEEIEEDAFKECPCEESLRK